MPTDEDISKLTLALKHERESHKETSTTLKAAQLSLKEANAKLETTGALQNPDVGALQAHIADAVAAALAVDKAQHTKATHDLTAALDTAHDELANAKIESSIREIAKSEFVLPSAIDTLVKTACLDLVYADGKIATGDGLKDAAQYVDGLKTTMPFLWPLSRGAGAQLGNEYKHGAGDSANPFAKGPGWSLTKQGDMLRTEPGRAAQLQAESKL
jgi:hypothetical protein